MEGFLLFEVMLGVAIFATGVIGLAYAVNNCLDAQAAMAEADRARLALENRMSEIFGGAVAGDAAETVQLEGAFDGISMKQTVVPLEADDEEGNAITGLNVVTLTAEWVSAGEKQSRQISFYVSTNL